jgi:hypothetical protein
MEYIHERSYSDERQAILDFCCLAGAAGAWVIRHLEDVTADGIGFERGKLVDAAMKASAAAEEEFQASYSVVSPRGIDVEIRRGYDCALVWATDGHHIILQRIIPQRQNGFGWHLRVYSIEERSWRMARLESLDGWA